MQSHSLKTRSYHCILEKEGVGIQPDNGYVVHIEPLVRDNSYTQRVLYTANAGMQLSINTLQPFTVTAPNVFAYVDQAIQVVEGEGKIFIGNATYRMEQGVLIVVPKNTIFKIENNRDQSLQYYTIYSMAVMHKGEVINDE